MADIVAICRRLEAMKSNRSQHENVWRDCTDHSFPLRGSGLQSDTLTAQEALDRTARLVDSTSTDAGLNLSANLQGGMTPANARWFGLEVVNADKASKEWLDGAAEQLHQEIHNSNFDSEAGDAMLDMVAIGWFVLFIDVDRDKGGFVFEAWPIAQCYLASSRADGIIDTIYRSYTLTAQQCVSEFGSSCSGQVTKKAENEPDAPVQLVHAIYPRTGANGKLAKNMPFASCKGEVDTKTELSESGFNEFPCAVPRWSKIPQTPYAVGPMFAALPDVRMLNKLKRMDLAGLDIAVSGMWIAEDDGVLNPRTIKIGPRKIIVANSVDSMKSLTTGTNWQLADERIAQLQAAIRKLLMADQLQTQDGPAMTATEVHARIALIRQMLGPTFGRMQAEYLRSMIERCFALAFRAGVFPPPPPTIQGRSFSVKYISPMARSQKLEDVTAIQNTLTYILTVAPLKPEILDNYDIDAMAVVLAEAQGVPQTCIRDMNAVAALRDARAQQQAQQQQAANAQQMQSMAAESAFKGAQNQAAKSA